MGKLCCGLAAQNTHTSALLAKMLKSTVNCRSIRNNSWDQFIREVPWDRKCPIAPNINMSAVSTISHCLRTQVLSAFKTEPALSTRTNKSAKSNTISNLKPSLLRRHSFNNAECLTTVRNYMLSEYYLLRTGILRGDQSGAQQNVRS